MIIKEKKMEFKPSAGEIGNLWSCIIGNQANLCMIEHWLYHAEDEELKQMIEKSKQAAKRIVDKGLELYQKAGFSPPIGFNVTTDVMPSAPKTMSDKLVLFTLQVLSEYGIYGYGLIIGKIETSEVLEYFKTNLNQSVELYEEITKLIKKKGSEHQHVYIPKLKQAEMVENHSFLAGWWGEQRPLSAIEIDNLIFSLRGVILAKTIFMLFTQTARDLKVRKFCQRGKELSGKRVEKLQSLNSAEGIPFQATYETEITDTEISPFSDRLIMFQAISYAQIAIARYGNALSFVARRDLSSIFAIYIVETGTFLDDGLNLMIEKKWLEQPPLAANYKNI
jgi:hypothetical protein